MKTIPNYHPPQDYRRPTKTQEKVYVPVNDYPEINFSMIANPLNPNQCFCFPPYISPGSSLDKIVAALLRRFQMRRPSPRDFIIFPPFNNP